LPFVQNEDAWDLLDPKFFFMLKAAHMTRLGLLAFLGLTVLAGGNAEAGSAVASGPFGEHVIVAGKKYSKAAAIKKALAFGTGNGQAPRRFWHRQTSMVKVRLLAGITGKNGLSAPR
jgi:hypothetical protein